MQTTMEKVNIYLLIWLFIDTNQLYASLYGTDCDLFIMFIIASLILLCETQQINT